MGGYNSGRRRRYASKADSMHNISLAQLRRWDVLRPGHRGTLTWSRNDYVTGRIGFAIDQASIDLYYIHQRDENSEPETIRERFPFAYTGQHFGGKRRWFVCIGCARRCSVLYGGKHFRCRQCHAVVYNSQYEPFPIGFINRTDRVRKRLGGKIGYSHPFPDRPQGMHQRTYERLMQADWDAQARLDRMLNMY